LELNLEGSEPSIGGLGTTEEILTGISECLAAENFVKVEEGVAIFLEDTIEGVETVGEGIDAAGCIAVAKHSKAWVEDAEVAVLDAGITET